MDNVWILGPCSIENEELYLSTGEYLYKHMQGKDWYYKASYDKANRTALVGKRGPGLDESLKLFAEIKKRCPGIKLTTDVHECWQVEKIAPYVDVVQIPAFLCRQTDLLAECGKHFDVVNIKKGQWINPDSTKHFVGKVKSQNPDCKVWMTERGTFFGYNQLIVDLGAVEAMLPYYDRVILDCTHSTQRKKGDFTGGDRELAKKYLLASSIFGYNGVFAECHPRPPEAYSDGDCQLYLTDVPGVLEQFEKIKKAM